MAITELKQTTSAMNPPFIGNTITGNSMPHQYSPTWERQGGGIYVTVSHLTMVNSLL
jgi:hypothetical protein